MTRLYAKRFCPAPSDGWLVPADASTAAAQARLLRNLRARALHEPLLEWLAHHGRGGPLRPVHESVAALLPGRPGPVAALTKADEIVSRLLVVLAGEAGRREHVALGAQIGLHLALAGVCASTVVAHGPARPTHVATRRALELEEGQRVQLGGADPKALVMDGVALDPWGPGLRRLPQVGPLVWTGPGAAPSSLGQAWAALEPMSAAAADVEGCLTHLAGVGGPLRAGSDDAAGQVTARGLLEAAAAMKLGVLRMADPLVLHPEDAEVFIAGLTGTSSVAWGFASPTQREALQRSAGLPVTPVGEGLVTEALRVLAL